MKSFRTVLTSFLLSAALIPAIAQTISPEDAKNHVGERETVCGLVAGKHASPQSQGAPTFVDMEQPYPNQTMTVLVWGRDLTTVGTLPSTGQLCVTGPIVLYRGTPEIILRDSGSWHIPSAELSNDRHYTNSDGQRVHSPAYSDGGVPAAATAVCRDGTYSFSQHRSGTCSHHGGVSRWL